jgi:DNA-binding transcriptional LysR family regulator
MDVDTRLLRAFRAVAEEGNLTRAAARLYVSQPALTKQIRLLEQQLCARLFARSKTGMTLTPPGEALAATAQNVLDAWDSAERAVRDAEAHESKVLRIGYLASAANERTQPILASFRERRPDWRVELRQAGWDDPIAGLASGDVAAAFLHLPFPRQADFATLILFSEPRCIAMSTTHPLAGRESLDFTEVLDEPFVAAPAATGGFRDHWLAVEARGGRPARIGAVTALPDDWLAAIASGDGIALAPESAARYYARPDIAYVPVTGVAPTVVALAWPAAPAEDSPLADFIRAAMEHTGPA